VDKGTQEEVGPRLQEMKAVSRQIIETKDPIHLALGYMTWMGLTETMEIIADINKDQGAHLKIIQLILEMIQMIDRRLAELDKRPPTENIQLENLRKKLRTQERKLKKHAPMLEFLEEWVEAQRNRYIGDHG